MKILDCLGDMCPMPLIKTQLFFKTLNVDESFKILVDHSCAPKSISEYFSNKNVDLEIIEVDKSIWEIYIKKKA